MAKPNKIPEKENKRPRSKRKVANNKGSNTSTRRFPKKNTQKSSKKNGNKRAKKVKRMVAPLSARDLTLENTSSVAGDPGPENDR